MSDEMIEGLKFAAIGLGVIYGGFGLLAWVLRRR